MTVADLTKRFAALEVRLNAAERAAALSARLDALCARIAAAERAAFGPARAAPSITASCSGGGGCNGNEAAARAALDAALAAGAASPVQQRLARELYERRVPAFQFVRVPGDYYDRPLAWRREQLQAASVHHLCKSIIMENTRAHPTVDGWSNPFNARYYLVIIQYTARFNNEKMCSHLYRLNECKVPKKYFNMRLCPEAMSDALSGFGHNGVSPVGLRERLPIVMSHRILNLKPDFFFCGGGEVDLKLGVPAAAFVEAYRDQPLLVMDVTADDADDEEDGAVCGD